MIQEKYEDTYESENIKCPYCGCFISDSWKYDFNDDTIECECPECDKKFWAGESVIRTYTGKADCKLNKKRHQFVKQKGYFKCEICGMIKSK